MPEGLVGITIEGNEEVQKMLDKFPDEARAAAGEEVANYLLNVFQTYPPPKYVTRAKAYGVTFFTERQRRWFFAALNSGEIQVPYKRTQGFRRSWQIVGEGEDIGVLSDAPYGHFLVGERKEQSRHAREIGWKSVSETIKDKMDKIKKKIDVGIKKGLRKAGAI